MWCGGDADGDDDADGNGVGVDVGAAVGVEEFDLPGVLDVQLTRKKASCVESPASP